MVQSERIRGQVDEPRIPSLCSSAPTEKPGVPRSIRNAENFSPLTLAKTVNRSANPLFVIHIFSPFSTHDLPSGDNTARVRQFIASEADDDSESAYAPIHSPVASLGRYFCFCAGVPYQTIGSVPIPAWALNATEKLASWLIDSAISADVTLSISMPPYCSGTSTLNSPSSPALRSNDRVTAKFLASISAAAGITSLVVNSTAVLAICRCSSVKSSGVKISSGRRSSIRKLPPLARIAVTAGLVVAISSAL